MMAMAGYPITQREVRVYEAHESIGGGNVGEEAMFVHKVANISAANGDDMRRCAAASSHNVPAARTPHTVHAHRRRMLPPVTGGGRFELNGLPPATRFFVQLRSYNRQGWQRSWGAVGNCTTALPMRRRSESAACWPPEQSPKSVTYSSPACGRKRPAKSPCAVQAR